MQLGENPKNEGLTPPTLGSSRGLLHAAGRPRLLSTARSAGVLRGGTLFTAGIESAEYLGDRWELRARLHGLPLVLVAAQDPRSSPTFPFAIPTAQAIHQRPPPPDASAEDYGAVRKYLTLGTGGADGASTGRNMRVRF